MADGIFGALLGDSPGISIRRGESAWEVPASEFQSEATEELKAVAINSALDAIDATTIYRADASSGQCLMIMDSANPRA